ncbi:MAG: DegV family protein [Lysinibacillus sp.]
MIKITADSTCDLSPDILETLDIALTPLHVLIDEEDFFDGISISPQDIFRHVGEHNRTCTTAAINVYEYEEFFSQFVNQYEAVVHINLGSDFSSCHQNAKIAAQCFDNVYVINSQNLSTGSGHLVYEAALLARDGHAAQEIIEKIEALIPKVNASFVIDRMDYLKKGGRCSSMEAFGATLLKIKPSIEVTHGKMAVGKKYRGTFESCLEKYIKDRLQHNDQIDKSRLFITHSMCTPETVGKVRSWITQFADFEEVIETSAGCTISAHCGPNTLGILYKMK